MIKKRKEFLKKIYEIKDDQNFFSTMDLDGFGDHIAYFISRGYIDRYRGSIYKLTYECIDAAEKYIEQEKSEQDTSDSELFELYKRKVLKHNDKLIIVSDFVESINSYLKQYIRNYDVVNERIYSVGKDLMLNMRVDQDGNTNHDLIDLHIRYAGKPECIASIYFVNDFTIIISQYLDKQTSGELHSKSEIHNTLCDVLAGYNEKQKHITIDQDDLPF